MGSDPATWEFIAFWLSGGTQNTGLVAGLAAVADEVRARIAEA